MVHGDDGRLAGSGLPDLRAELREFLTTGKTRLFLRNIADRAARLVAGQQRGLRLGRLALDGGPGPDAVLAAFDTRMAGLDRQRSAVAGKIADRIEAGLPDLLAARSPAWQSSLLDLIEPASPTTHWPPRRWTAPSASVLEKAGAELERASREVIVGGWLERRTGEVLEMVTGHGGRRDRLVAGDGPVTRRGRRRDRRPGRRR